MEEKKVKGNVITLADFAPMAGEWHTNAQEFADQVKAGEVTHGVMIYRDKHGAVHWRIFNEESGTYILGLLARLTYLINEVGTVPEEF